MDSNSAILGIGIAKFIQIFQGGKYRPLNPFQEIMVFRVKKHEKYNPQGVVEYERKKPLKCRLHFFNNEKLGERIENDVVFNEFIIPRKNMENVVSLMKKTHSSNSSNCRISLATVMEKVDANTGEFEVDYENHEIYRYARHSLKNLPKNLLSFALKQVEMIHQTSKPVNLCEYLIKTYTDEGDEVLDMTMGCGTTGVAAKNTNRDFIGIELEKTFFDIAKKRIEEK